MKVPESGRRRGDEIQQVRDGRHTYRNPFRLGFLGKRPVEPLDLLWECGYERNLELAGLDEPAACRLGPVGVRAGFGGGRTGASGAMGVL
jgi:hypothetical protein